MVILYVHVEKHVELKRLDFFPCRKKIVLRDNEILCVTYVIKFSFDLNKDTF